MQYSLTNSKLFAASAALALFGLTVGPAEAAEIFSPMGDAVEVERRTLLSDSTSTQQVTYVIEARSGAVKYEDAPVGLGEEGSEQTDVFHVTAEKRNTGDPITVITKAAQSMDMTYLDPKEGASVKDDNGFKITVAGVDGDQFKLKVHTWSPDRALSHVTFGFDGSLANAGTFADLPVSSSDTVEPYDDILYGINPETGDLVRYDFTEQTSKVVGPVSMDGDTLTNIDAAAYIPGLQNTFTFWEDPADGTTKMVYVDVETGQAAQVGDSLGPGKVIGATATELKEDGSGGRTFIVKEVVDSTSPVAQLVEVDPQTGATTPLMELPRQYDSVTTSDGKDFYATDGDHVYRLNPNEGEAVNIGIFPDRDFQGIDQVSDKLSVFDSASDQLLPAERTDRINLGSQDVGMNDVGSVVASDPATDPYGEPDHYD
jgi:hypothetical protein